MRCILQVHIIGSCYTILHLLSHSNLGKAS
jgi:hypothetical protein